MNDNVNWNFGIFISPLFLFENFRFAIILVIRKIIIPYEIIDLFRTKMISKLIKVLEL